MAAAFNPRAIAPASALTRRARGIGLDPRLWLGALVVLIGVLRWVVLADNGWLVDDNLYLALGHQGGFGRIYLFSNTLQHFGVLYRAAWTVIAWLMPISWRWALLGALLTLGACVILLDRVLRLLLDSSWAPLLLAGSFGLSALLITSLQWVSSGLQAFPTVFGDLLCLYAYLRYLQEPARRWVLLGGAAIAFALLFYEKGCFMIGYLALVRIAFLTPTLSWTELRRVAVRERAFWLTLVTVEILWFIGLKIGHGGGVFISPSTSQWLDYWRAMWAFSLIPAVFGLHTLDAGSTTDLVTAIALQVPVLIAVVVSIRRKAIAWRVWAVLVVTVLANGFLVGEERIVALNSAVGAGEDPRYALDFSWLIPLLVGFACSASRSFWPDTERLHRPLTVPASGRARLTGLVVAIVGVAYLIATQKATHIFQARWLGTEALHYEQTLERTASTDARSDPTAALVVADAPVPDQIVTPNFTPYDRLSWVLRFYVPSARVDGPMGRTLLTVTPAGALVPARLTVLDTVSFPSGRCRASGVGATRTIARAIPPAGAASAGSFYLLVHHGASTATALRYDGGAAIAASNYDPTIALSAGPGTSIGYLGPVLPRRIELTVPAAARVCITSLQVATLQVATLTAG